MRRKVRFRTGLHASEDALFVAEYLLHEDEPMLGLLASTAYHYRRRQARDSAIDRFRIAPETYHLRFTDGYLPLMLSSPGGPPEWLQSMFVYECQWLLPVQLTLDGYASVLDDEQRRLTLDALAACARLVTSERLFAYEATALPFESRLLLTLLAGRELPGWATAVADPALMPWSKRRVLRYSGGGHAAVLTDRRGHELRVEPISAETPDYFSQRLLTRSEQRLARTAWVAVDGARHRIARRRPGESDAEATDRLRRRWSRTGRGAVPATANQVRVWSPDAADGGDASALAGWHKSVARQHWRYLVRRLRRLRAGR